MRNDGGVDKEKPAMRNRIMESRIENDIPKKKEVGSLEDSATASWKNGSHIEDYYSRIRRHLRTNQQIPREFEKELRLHEQRKPRDTFCPPKLDHLSSQ